MARDYAKLMSRFWSGETGRRLRGDPAAQVVAVYLITGCQSNMIGLYTLPLPLLVHETGVLEVEVRRCLVLLEELGFARYDEDAEAVWVVEGARYQIGSSLREGDKVIPWVRKQLREARGNPFVGPFWSKYGVAYRINENPERGFEGPSEALPGGPSGSEGVNSTPPAAENTANKLLITSEPKGSRRTKRKNKDPSKPLTSPSGAPPKPGAVVVAVAVQDQEQEKEQFRSSPSAPPTPSTPTPPPHISLAEVLKLNAQASNPSRRKNSDLSPLASQGTPTEAEEKRVAELRRQANKILSPRGIEDPGDFAPLPETEEDKP
jgi:hypothetical protein